jgi:hypothetical protein
VKNLYIIVSCCVLASCDWSNPPNPPGPIPEGSNFTFCHPVKRIDGRSCSINQTGLCGGNGYQATGGLTYKQACELFKLESEEGPCLASDIPSNCS